MMVAARGLGSDLIAKGGASDLVQETLLGAYRDFGNFEGRTHEELLAWLRRILRNNLAVFRRRYRETHKRNAAREVSMGAAEAGSRWGLLPAEQETPGGAAARREQVATLFAALGRLGETHRQVVLWYQYDRLTFEEIGRRLGRSAEAARKLWSRALVRLSEELGPAYDPQG
jgi:RNA polymerase sigma-70 factor (ECF subfamily)